MTYQIQGKVALVTGANRGLGKSIVEGLLARGAKRVYAAARSLESLADVVALAPAIVIPVQLDVISAEDIARVSGELPALDLLINNAGTATGSNFSGETSLAIANSEMAVNYFGPINLTHALLPLLQKSAGAAVVNVSSIAAISSFPILGPYSASKAALHSFTQGLRAELNASGVFVQGVYPGPMDTRMTEGYDMAKAATADVVNVMLDGLEGGVEDIFPDEFAQAMYGLFIESPKKLEQQFAQMMG